MQRLTISLQRKPALQVTRTSIGRNKLVYVIVTDKKLKYPDGNSRIAYIGTTRKGVGRIARSAAYRAPEVLGIHGVRSFDVRIVTCRARQHVKTWAKLERAMLLIFKEAYGVPPRCNTHGVRMRERNEFEYFSRSRIRKILEELA